METNHYIPCLTEHEEWLPLCTTYSTCTGAAIWLEAVARVTGTGEAAWLLHTHLLTVIRTQSALRHICTRGE